ncbi:hypothetical protein [Flocculibacter collagenilyticus]|uniref:hypothetical protein n=1 Tax=Flocculibacter collagenilyticus TaxID=2744479 RepID=UPI0018F6ED67|nr:hypothetical protein [Flocculibacter collagenilyticus]
MKLLTFLFVFTIFSSLLYANSIESFNRIEVNPYDDSAHKVIASIHLVVDSPLADAADVLAAREIIAISLSSLSLQELTKNGIDNAKHNILKQLKSSGLINTIQNVYVTDLTVEFVGANRATVFVKPQKGF